MDNFLPRAQFKYLVILHHRYS